MFASKLLKAQNRSAECYPSSTLVTWFLLKSQWLQTIRSQIRVRYLRGLKCLKCVCETTHESYHHTHFWKKILKMEMCRECNVKKTHVDAFWHQCYIFLLCNTFHITWFSWVSWFALFSRQNPKTIEKQQNEWNMCGFMSGVQVLLFQSLWVFPIFPVAKSKPLGEMSSNSTVHQRDPQVPARTAQNGGGNFTIGNL